MFGFVIQQTEIKRYQKSISGTTMNRYKLNQPKPPIDFTPVLGSRVKLTAEYANIFMMDSERKLTKEYIAAIRGARGLITDDFPEDDQWEVIWDGYVVRDHGLTFFPPKDGVELE